MPPVVMLSLASSPLAGLLGAGVLDAGALGDGVLDAVLFERDGVLLTAARASDAAP